MSKLVMVECISQFRQRYVVEVPEDETWALDTVTCEDAEEFSQKHLGETIVSHRVISKEEYLEICDQDNDYLQGWSDEQKFGLITRIDEDGNIISGTGASWKREDDDIQAPGSANWPFPTDRT
jgi:hypothetical protein